MYMIMIRDNRNCKKQMSCYINIALKNAINSNTRVYLGICRFQSPHDPQGMPDASR